MIVLLAVCLFSCAGDPEGSKVLVTINEKNITVKDFRVEMAKRPANLRDYVQTVEGRQRLLSEMIKKELLLQEANRRGLIQNQGVLLEISQTKEQLKKQLEEQAKMIAQAIKNIDQEAKERVILNQLGKIEIENKVAANDAEMKQYYTQHRKEFQKPDGSFSSFKEIKPQIQKMTLQQKQQERFNAWLSELQKAARVQVNEVNLKDFKL